MAPVFVEISDTSSCKEDEGHKTFSDHVRARVTACQAEDSDSFENNRVSLRCHTAVPPYTEIEGVPKSREVSSKLLHKRKPSTLVHSLYSNVLPTSALGDKAVASNHSSAAKLRPSLGSQKSTPKAKAAQQNDRKFPPPSASVAQSTPNRLYERTSVTPAKASNGVLFNTTNMTRTDKSLHKSFVEQPHDGGKARIPLTNFE